MANYYNQTTVYIKVLGAGQTVGRSCVIVELENRRIMFDCGSHVGYKDERKYPNFNLLVGNNNMEGAPKIDEENNLNVEVNISIVNSNIADKEKLINNLKRINEIIDCVIISHFHMDHIGALPFFTETLQYKGTIIMSYPTKALSPVLLLDGCKISDMKWEKKNLEKQIKMLNEKSDDLLNYNINRIKKDPWNITEENIYNCINKVVGLQVNETYELGDISITPYYAGHVLGACMYRLEVNNISVIYTGDYNTIPDKHLGSTKIPVLTPEIFISESTYASYVRPTRKSSELELCNLVNECVHKGGKVLIPVFAIGRAQELSILLEEYWEKMKINCPIYFGCGLTENANKYYKIYSSWINNDCVSTEVKNLFDFSNITQFSNNYLNENRPMVLFATPGMLHTGLALKAFKAWASNPNNLIILPGYCVQGTIGHKLIMGEKKILLDGSTYIYVNCKIIYLSFSAHADSNGIQQLIKHVMPKNVIFVHGDKNGMEKLSKHISNQYHINSICPYMGQNCQFNFCKYNINYVYLDRKIYNNIIQKVKLNKQKTSKGLYKNARQIKGGQANILSYNGNVKIPFTAYILYRSINEKPLFFFLSESLLFKYLTKKHVPMIIWRDGKQFDFDYMFDTKKKKKLNKMHEKKEKIKNGTDITIEHYNEAEEGDGNQKNDNPNDIGDNNILLKNKSIMFNNYIQSDINITENDKNNANDLSSSIEARKRKFNEISETNNLSEEQCEHLSINSSKMLKIAGHEEKYNNNVNQKNGENEQNITGKLKGYLKSETNLNAPNNHCFNIENIYNDNDKSNSNDKDKKKRHVYIKDKENINLPLINLRFKEEINIAYQCFYNFVITFFQEIVKAENKNNMGFLGKNIIVKNVKINQNCFFFLSFHSLRAIHDGNNSLLMQWSYVDDAKSSVVKKFINCVIKYAQEE
ncbi:cleavage and polyadenylation specificity factor, putative [Plasmodium vinckei brucechwatti]|uniref:Cleavage and polyadenylation specificity factor, putative n=1 Tax=Plasmodium vinckei brucechwatti TaxID=119398 RepID=A0A6V7S791_PLAVN|nr:cleavage and polyadenylation specificity factor, putative [Plasmodium vinckei brucechwatti]